MYLLDILKYMYIYGIYRKLVEVVNSNLLTTEWQRGLGDEGVDAWVRHHDPNLQTKKGQAQRGTCFQNESVMCTDEGV